MPISIRLSRNSEAGADEYESFGSSQDPDIAGEYETQDEYTLRRSPSRDASTRRRRTSKVKASMTARASRQRARTTVEDVVGEAGDFEAGEYDGEGPQATRRPCSTRSKRWSTPRRCWRYRTR